ncbi:MAG TPA: hypothetical protein VGO40_08095 [Longimicrobium sp.]|jgi:hypothetical protein|nr:hypothetical protein [Longimicrobium sp.]
MLRIGVGYEENQSFEFDCSECLQSIKGHLPLDQTNYRVGTLHVTGATVVGTNELPADFREYPHVITINPDFPTPAEDAFSPFIAAFQRHGFQGLRERTRRAGLAAQASREQGDLKRVIHNYQQERWVPFGASVREFLPDAKLERQIDRNRALYQILESYLAPFASSKDHVRLIEFFTDHVNGLAQADAGRLQVMIEKLLGLGVLQDVQRSALDATVRLFEVFDEFRPVLTDWDPENPDASFPAELVVTGKARFHEVKSLYVDAYETCARGLTIVASLINLSRRGDPDSFLPHPTFGKKKAIPFASSIADFHQKAHGAKLPMMAEEQIFFDWLNGALDSQLRNAIGHNTVKYRRDADQIQYATDRQATKWKTITYGEFLFRILRVVLRAHQMNHLVKILYVSRFFHLGDVDLSTPTEAPSASEEGSAT